MNLPESFQSYGTAVWAKNTEIIYSWSTETGFCSLTIPASSSSEFDIEIAVEKRRAMISWGNWHTHFELDTDIDQFIEELFGLLRDMLSSDMRIRELRAAGTPYRGILESFDGGQWSTEHENGLLFWNYFGKRTVKIYSNSQMSPRMQRMRPAT